MSPPLDQPPTSAPPNRRGCLRIFLWVAVISCLILAAVIVAAFVCEPKDEPPPDLEHLVVHLPIVAPEDNAYVVLEEIAAGVQALEGQPFLDVILVRPAKESLDDVVSMMRAHGEAPGDPLIQGVRRLAEEHGEDGMIAAHPEQSAGFRALQASAWEIGGAQLEPLVDRVGEAVNRGRMAIPALTYSPTQEFEYLSQWMRISRLNLALARHHLDRGDASGAMTRSLETLRLGDLFMEARGVLVHALVATAVQRDALDAMWEITASGACSSDLLLETLRALEEETLCRDGWLDSLRQEFQFQVHGIDLLSAGHVSQVTGEDLGPAESIIPRWGYFWQPNRCKRLYSEAFGAIIENATRLGKQEQGLQLDAPPVDGRVGLRHFLQGNVIGNILYSIIMPVFATLPGARRSLETQLGALRIHLALRAHQAAGRELPETLQELVPGILDEVPTDPWDGAPLRYSRALGRIWSVEADQPVSPPSKPTTFTFEFGAE